MINHEEEGQSEENEVVYEEVTIDYADDGYNNEEDI
jgi:hypothetical protein